MKREARTTRKPESIASKPGIWWILAVLALAVAVRAAHFGFTLARDPFLSAPVVDAGLHDAWAKQLNGLPTPSYPPLLANQAYYKPPLYPYLLGLAYRVFGVDYPLLRALQLLTGALSCLLLALLAARVSTPRTGLIAGLIAAVYGPLIHEEGQLLSTGLETLLCLAFLLALTSAARTRHWPGWLAAGILLSAAAITRPPLLIAGLTAAGWLLWPRRWDLSRPGWTAPLAFLVGCALLIVPVSLRNLVVGKERVLISANGGINFFTGNHAAADGFSAIPPGAVWEKYQQQAHGAGALKPGAASAYWVSRGWRELRAMPAGEIAALYARKLAAVIGEWEIRNNVSYQFSRRYSPLLLPSRVCFGLLFPLAALGLLVTADRRALAPILAFAAALLLTLLPFFICARFRLPLVPLLMIPAAVGLEWLWTASPGLLRAPSRRAWGAIGGALLAALLCHADLSGARGADNGARDYFLEGLAFSQHDEPLRAIESLTRATQLAPSDPDPWFRLGLLHESRGDLPAAESAYQQAARLEPSFFDAHSNLGAVLVNRGEYARAEQVLLRATRIFPDSSRGWHNLAMARAGSGKPEEALESARRAARLDPGNVQAVLLQADLLVSDPERLDEAEEAARTAKSMAPELPATWVALARVLLARGESRQAVELLAAAPGSPEVGYLMGRALEESGQRDAARRVYSRVVQAFGATKAGQLSALRLRELNLGQ